MIEPWGDDSPNRQILLNSTSSCVNEITSYYEKVSYIEGPDPGNLRRPSFSWFCQLHREVALRGCHDEVGHLGLEHMLDLMCDWFFWSHMTAQVKEHICKCHPCLTFKTKQPKVLLENIVATHPLEFIHLDYLCLESRKGLEENVLVVTDHFTQYTQAYVTQTQTAQTTAKTLWDKFIVCYGMPGKILSDQGRNFESQLVANLCKLMGTQNCKLAHTTHRVMASVRGSTPL